MSDDTSYNYNDAFFSFAAEAKLVPHTMKKKKKRKTGNTRLWYKYYLLVDN